MVSQMDQRGSFGGRARLLEAAGDALVYHVYGGADLSIVGIWCEEEAGDQEQARGVDQVRGGLLEISTADVSSPQLRKDRVTIDGEVWTVMRSVGRSMGLVTLGCELRTLREVRRPERERF